MLDSSIAEILLRYHDQRDAARSPFAEYRDIISSRDSVLAEFQPIFAGVENIKENCFRRFLQMKNNRHWTGLHRQAGNACENMSRLRKSLTYLLDERVEVARRIDALTGTGEFSIRGLDTGILTPILLVRYPDKYGVWNGKSEAAMKSLRIWPKFARGTSKGERFAVLNSIFVRLAEETELDLWTLDGLWHVVNIVSHQDAESWFSRRELEERDFLEGKAVESSGLRYERNPEARQACLKRNGYDCIVCGFNFFRRYGEIGLNFIHVHHVDDLALSHGERTVDPKTDLVPVCPNCHAMLHKGVKKSRSIEDLRARLRSEA